MNNNDCWGSINPSDVSIDTTNSKEMMTESHITEFYIETRIQRTSFT